MQTTYQIGSGYIDKIRSEAIFASILISLLIVSIPVIMFMDYWYYLLPLSIIAAPLWIKYRWRQYQRECEDIRHHSLLLDDSRMTLIHKNTQAQIELDALKRMDINLRKGEIHSLHLVFDDQRELLVEYYQRMEHMVKHLSKFVKPDQIKRHRWFHRT